MKASLVLQVVVVTVITLAIVAPPIHAEILPRTTEIEVYGGVYVPYTDVIDNKPTLGLRVGHNLSKRFNITGTFGFISSDNQFEITPSTVADIEYDIVFGDLSFMYQIRPDSRFVTTVYAGPGFAFITLEGVVTGPGGPAVAFTGLEDDTFTFHIGAGFKYDLKDNMYLRFASRLRYFEQREEDDLDQEITIGIGWKFL